MILLHYIKYKLYFFYWFKLYYTFKNYIAYLFIKDACPITTRNKTLIWELANGSLIESKHSLLRNLKILLKTKKLKLLLTKLLHTTNTKYIIQQNNFTNTNLNTIGKQLTIIEKHIKKSLFFVVETTKPI